VRAHPEARPRVSWIAVGSLVSVLGLASGCAHETVAARQLASLEEGLNRDTAERDRIDPRLDTDRLQQEQSKVAPIPLALPSQLPVPHTVDVTAAADARLASEGALNGEDPNDTAPRPVIRVVGSGIVRRRGGGRDDRIEETLPDEPVDGARVGPPIQVGAPPSSALDPNAKKAYDAALGLVNGHDYDHALEAFAAFLVKWPDHPNADNAMYWRGECYFAKGELARAAEEFDGAIKRFPMGNKVPDCLLKLGICEQKLGNHAKSLAYFERLSREYPRSEAARRIPTDRTAGHDAGRAGPQENP
jgi:tol-pal system protein YbgF